MTIRATIAVILFAIMGYGPASAQKTAVRDLHYKTELKSLQKAIETNFYEPSPGFYREHDYPGKAPHLYSYLWPLCALIQAGNEIEKAGLDTGLIDRTFDIIGHYEDTAAPASGYDSYIVSLGKGGRYYDDNQWIGLALMDGYFRTKKKNYLLTGLKIYRFMMTGFDTVSGGGLYWKEGDHSTKNTCSNGPGILLALQLYQATKDKSYLDTARLLYAWVNDHLKAPSGLYYDNLRTGSGKIGKALYSYNTGTMMESNVVFYELTGEKQYLQTAIQMADSSAAYFYGTGKFRDGYWFNAVLLRAYQHLLKVHPDRKYIGMFERCTDAALKDNRQKNGLMGKDKAVDLVNQGGMLEILARLYAVEHGFSQRL